MRERERVCVCEREIGSKKEIKRKRVRDRKREIDR